MQYKLWSKLVVSLIAVCVVAIYGINFLVDPYGDREILCENIYKPVLNERAKKYNYIFYDKNIEKYDSLILGSSRVMKIAPSHTTEGKFYNFGVHVANNTEKLFLIQEWIKRKPLKKIYFGIDFYNFHNKKSQLTLNKNKFQEQYSHNYFSIETLKMSSKTLKYTLNNTPQVFFKDDGELVYFENDTMIKNGSFDFSDTKYLQEAQQNYQNNYLKDKFEIEYNVFETLKKVKKICSENNIELYVFITPSHTSDIKKVTADLELNNKFDTIRAHLREIFGTVYDFSLESPENNDNKNFYDVHHYRANLGDKILNTLKQPKFNKGNN